MIAVVSFCSILVRPNVLIILIVDQIHEGHKFVPLILNPSIPASHEACPHGIWVSSNTIPSVVNVVVKEKSQWFSVDCAVWLYKDQI